LGFAVGGLRKLELTVEEKVTRGFIESKDT
jgi:hypothetical protein